MKKLDLLYEGKAKKVYKTEDPDVLIVDYKDDATAFNGLKKGTIVGKGATGCPSFWRIRVFPPTILRSSATGRRL